jgi:FixJ family two-component response regulator
MSVVCLVDDDPSVLKATTRLLCAAGFEVRAFQSAAAYLAQCDQAPGCLVLDLHMPGVGGLQLQQILGLRGDAAPIVFLSGESDVPPGAEAMNGSAVEFLLKPVDATALIRAVRAALGHAAAGVAID